MFVVIRFCSSIMILNSFSGLQIFCICCHICLRILISWTTQAILAGLSKHNYFLQEPTYVNTGCICLVCWRLSNEDIFLLKRNNICIMSVADLIIWNQLLLILGSLSRSKVRYFMPLKRGCCQMHSVCIQVSPLGWCCNVWQGILPMPLKLPFILSNLGCLRHL